MTRVRILLLRRECISRLKGGADHERQIPAYFATQTLLGYFPS